MNGLSSECVYQHNVIVVFHSYPKKPCVDGLMAAILMTKLIGDNSNIVYVPYWRTQESFVKLKNTTQKVDLNHTKIIYVDCSPDLEQEVKFLETIISSATIDVIDHHPLKEETPMKRLIEKRNFKFIFDSDCCATKIIYSMLPEEQKALLNVEALTSIIQYSEYEGMNPTVAGKEESEGIAKSAFKKALTRCNASTAEQLHVLTSENKQLYYVLDHILADQENWSFLYDQNLDSKEYFERFQYETALYLTNSRDVINGTSDVYSEEETKRYMKSFEEMKMELNNGKKVMVDDMKVFLVSIDIFTYGRILEPYAIEKMVKTGTNYAIMMNSPTKRNDMLSYYFSLRRRGDYDARDLAKKIMKITGSVIGGGHPWGSGVTLNEEQYEIFMKSV